jgi:hypothetical protein
MVLERWLSVRSAGWTAQSLYRRNQVESDHSYSAYPGASVRDVRAGLELRSQLETFAKMSSELSPDRFAAEFNRLLVNAQNKLGTFGPTPE